MRQKDKLKYALAGRTLTQSPAGPPPAPELALRSATSARTVLISGDFIIGQLRIESTGLCAVTVESVTLSLTLAHDAAPFAPPRPTGAQGEGLNAISQAVRERIALLSPLGHALAIRLGGEPQAPTMSSPTTAVCLVPGRVAKKGYVDAAFGCHVHPSWLPVLDALDANKLYRHGVFGYIQVTGLVVGAPYPSGTEVDMSGAALPKIPVVFRDVGEPVVTGHRTPPRRCSRADIRAAADTGGRSHTR